MNDHIDQLAEWWENAEDAPANPGDRIIERHVCERDEDTYYTVGVHREGMSGLIGKSSTRILARAPKPAWHNAVAVMAVTPASPSRDALVGAGAGEWYSYRWNRYVKSDDLRDVTPLIEAKVTDEMVLKALNDKWGLSAPSLYHYSEEAVSVTRDMISAALGVDTEGSSDLQEEANDH